MEEISGHRTAVEDPFLPIIAGQQPKERFDALQSQIVDEMAAALG